MRVLAVAATGAIAGKPGHVGKLTKAGMLFGAATGEQHPDYARTMAEQEHLLTAPCSAVKCPMGEKFNEWALSHEKPYAHKSGLGAARGREEEYAARQAIFASNMQTAHNLNSKSNGLAVYGLTKFSDLTEEEFKVRNGLRMTEEDKMKWAALPRYTPEQDFLQASSSTSKDWVAEGMTTPIKDQGQCGSCWAHSVVEQMESMALTQGLYSTDAPFIGAPQELVSCDKDDNGCNGGNPVQAFEEMEDMKLEAESDYPYVSGFTKKDMKCKKDDSKGVLSVTDVKVVEGEDNMQKFLLKKGPLAVAVNANSNWQHYVGGIMEAYECEGQLDHAVQAVGVKTDGYQPYYMVRNSWGPDWGENGVIRLAANDDTCGVSQMVSTCTVSNDDVSKGEVV